METSTHDLRNMVMCFRKFELQELLSFAGRNKSGKKEELMTRALSLLKTPSASFQTKIKELHKRRFQTSENSDTYSNKASYARRAWPGVTPVTRGSGYSSQHGTSISTNGMSHPTNFSVSSHGNKNMPVLPPHTEVSSTYPVHPDVRFKILPFYDVLGELLRPSCLIPSSRSDRFQVSSFVFYLSPTQVDDIMVSRGQYYSSKKETEIQIQLRFCLLETGCEQSDAFPPGISVKVNNMMCPLPNPIPTNKVGVEPKRPGRPLNITNHCALSPTISNTVTVSWSSGLGKAYAVGLYLVRRLSSDTLLHRLKATGIRNSDHTRAIIKEKLRPDPDSEIATSSLKGSLICPLGKMKMKLPCKPLTCGHLQCFDANNFLLMNERKPTWVCPVCDKPATFHSLAIDGLFVEILEKAPADCIEVQFSDDGSWEPVKNKKEVVSVSPVVLDRSPGGPSVTILKSSKQAEIIDIDLTIDSDTEDYSPLCQSPVSPVNSSLAPSTDFQFLLSSNGADLNAEKLSSESSTTIGNSLYENTLLNSLPPSSYNSLASTSISDFVASEKQVYPSYTNFDMSSLLQSSENTPKSLLERYSSEIDQVISFEGASSSNNPGANLSPEVISLD